MIYTLRAAPIHTIDGAQAFMVSPTEKKVGKEWTRQAFKRYQGRGAFVVVGTGRAPKQGDPVFSDLKKPVWDTSKPFPGRFRGWAVKAPFGWTVVAERPADGETVHVPGTMAEWKAKRRPAFKKKEPQPFFPGNPVTTPPLWMQEEERRKPGLRLRLLAVR